MNGFKKVLIAGTSISILAASAALAEEVKVGGGGASVATVFAPVKPHFEKATGINLINLKSSPKLGIVDLASGKLDAATGAVPLDATIAAAQKDGANVDKNALTVLEVGRNKTVILVHKDNPVAKLDKEQMKRIFTGKISNWKEVGGADREIIVVWGKNTPGQNAQFTREILDGEPVMKEILESTDYAGVKNAVASNPDAVGIDPLAMAGGDVKAVATTPELTSPIYLVTKGKPSAAVQKLVDFIKNDGQKYVIR